MLGYNLPPSFDTLAAAGKVNEEAKSMIDLGYFHAIGKSLIQSYRENKLPLPDPAKPLDAFFDTRPDYNPLLNTDMVVTLSKRMQHLVFRGDYSRAISCTDHHGPG